MGYLSVGEMATSLGVTTQTLRNWDKSGKLKPAYIAKSGYRYYSEEQFKLATGLFFNSSSSDKQLDLLAETVAKHETLLTELKQQNDLILSLIKGGDISC